jgi:hypothetical protein
MQFFLIDSLNGILQIAYGKDRKINKMGSEIMKHLLRYVHGMFKFIPYFVIRASDTDSDKLEMARILKSKIR